MKDKKKRCFEIDVNVISIMTVVLSIVTIVAIAVVSLVSAATTETTSDEVCEVEVVEAYMFSDYVKGAGNRESYYVTVKGNVQGENFCDVIETDKEICLACLEKETVQIRIVKTVDCFNDTKQTVTILGE